MATATTQKAYNLVRSTQHRHVAWVDIYGDGTMHEVAVMKEDRHGNLLFFKVNDLDAVDRRRLAGALTARGTETLELWEVLANRTLNNGINALTYFNQLVHVLGPNGKLLEVRSGQAGVVAPR